MSNWSKYSLFGLFLAFFIWSVYSCTYKIAVNRSVVEVEEIESLIGQESYTLNKPDKVKIHDRKGHLYVAEVIVVDHENQELICKGYEFGINRSRIGGTKWSLENITLNFDDIVLIEVNETKGWNLISPMLMTLTTFTGIGAIYCIMNPKSCFGSCPTFYLMNDGEEILQAEGFSSSISRSLEEEDIDPLPNYVDGGSELLLKVKNEAMETHYIKKVEILGVHNPQKLNVYWGESQFLGTNKPSMAIGIDGGSIVELSHLQKIDKREYLSKSDSIHLATRESIVLEFPEQDGQVGSVIVTKRQSLMTTFLFYEAMGQMGSRIGEWIAKYERSDPRVRSAQKTIYDILGGIEVSVWMDNQWVSIGIINEQGPIASESHLLPVERDGSFSRVRLTFTKGLWRIDAVQVASIVSPLDFSIIYPKEVLVNYEASEKDLRLYTSNDLYKVNQPGDSQLLVFELPSGVTPFIRSEGYYVEWMRSEWLKCEDQNMVRTLIFNPNKWLKLMTPDYVKVEDKMDSLFWKSKFNSDDYLDK